MLRASTFVRQRHRGVMSGDRTGRKIAVHRLQLLHWRFPYQVRYLNPVTKVADKCDFSLSPDWQKAFRPFASAPARNRLDLWSRR